MTVLLGLALLAGACGVPAAPASARLWTLDDYAALYQGGGTAPGVAPLPPAAPLQKLLAMGDGGHYRLVIAPTFEEGYPAAYVTSDAWQGFDEVWVQTLYVQVSGFGTAGEPLLFPADDPRSRPIFSVGQKSRFYAPYWEVLYVQLSADMTGGFQSTTAILSNRDRLPPLRRGGARTMSLLSAGLMIDPPEINRDLDPALPPPDKVGPTVTRGHGFLDGSPVDYLDFGSAQFQWDADRVVGEVPLYELSFRDDAGQLQPFGGPKVGGFGPPFSGRAPQPVSTATQPRYGGYWRFYTVELPARARIFAPPQFPMFRDALLANHVPIAEGAGDIAAAAAEDLRKFVGRVTLDQSCFDNLQAITQCNSWLTSQEQLESELDITAFNKLDVTVTCPFVSYAGVPVNTLAAADTP